MHQGHHLVETIEKCSCMDTKCYRVDYFQSYWKQNTAEGNNTTTGRTEKVTNLRIAKLCPTRPRKPDLF